MPYNSRQVKELQTERDKAIYDGMDDAAFHVAVTTKNLDDVADPLAILNYTMTTEFRNSTIYGRIAQVSSVLADRADGDYGDLLMGAGNTIVAITRRHVAAARAFMRLTQTDSGLAVPLTNAELQVLFDDLTSAGNGCHAMAVADKDALVALSQNQKTPAQAAGLPNPSLGDVARTT